VAFERRDEVRGRIHRGLGRDIALAASVWLAAIAPAALAGALSGAVLRSAAVGLAVVAAVAVAVRHLRRLTAQLRDAEAREAALSHRATHDPLTGLANRTLLFERLELDLRRLGRTPGTVLVAYLDVDDLKLVNDAYGHAAGDRLLRAAAQRLTGAVRDVDTVARVGGDEFVVTCVVDGPEAAHHLVERLTAAARPSLHPGGGDGLSLGWVLAEGADDDAATLVARADAAMFRDKARRRGERGSAWLPLPGERRQAVGPCGCPAGYGSHLAGCLAPVTARPDHALLGR
jgi:diguanylate cyclase (GGDEF)-like protein